MPAPYIMTLLLAIAACSAPPRGQPADAVRAFFGAAGAGDCEAAFATLARAYRADLEQRHSCPESIEDLRLLALDAVIDTRVDGRNSGAHLVRVRLRGRQTDSMIRVEAEAGQWRISSL